VMSWKGLFQFMLYVALSCVVSSILLLVNPYWLRYLDLPVQLDVRGDPLLWWKQHHAEYPVLATIARIYLAIPAPQATTERSFSMAKRFCTEDRTSLSPENLEELVFLKRNFRELWIDDEYPWRWYRWFCYSMHQYYCIVPINYDLYCRKVIVIKSLNVTILQSFTKRSVDPVDHRWHPL
jgi:hypothetical protein